MLNLLQRLAVSSWSQVQSKGHDAGVLYFLLLTSLRFKSHYFVKSINQNFRKTHFKLVSSLPMTDEGQHVIYKMELALSKRIWMLHDNQRFLALFQISVTYQQNESTKLFLKNYGKSQQLTQYRFFEVPSSSWTITSNLFPTTLVNGTY